MNADQLRTCLEAIGWSQRHLALTLNTHPTTVRRWAQDKKPIPSSVGLWLDTLAAFHNEHAKPQGWQSNHEKEHD